MTEQKPYRVEVAVRAPREAVWKALTDPAEIRRWHGWDYDGLDDEIHYIYVDHATPHPPDRIELAEGADRQLIELVADGPITIVRLTRPGSLAGAEAVYDVIEQGWIAFSQQLRHYLELHPGEDRRTIYLDGEASPAKVLAALQARVPGRPWHADLYQHGIATDLNGRGLVILAAANPIDSDQLGPVSLTVTTHGLDDDAFAATMEDWQAWWSDLVVNPQAASVG